jgi:3-methyladenine DNA glycosylase AlkD
MNTNTILAELKSLGNDNIKRIFISHGVKEPLYGVKIEDLKKFQKKIKKNHQLSLELYNTGVADAMYLAGLIADEQKISQKDLKSWADQSSGMLSEYTVPWVAAESAHGTSLALEWINAEKENLQIAGWATLSSLVSIKPDSELDIKNLKELLARVIQKIHLAPGSVQCAMNGYIISIGCYVKELTEEAENTGKAIGKLSIIKSGTVCKVPYAPDYIRKVANKGHIGKKRKMARC